jgi:glutathione S-transferase
MSSQIKPIKVWGQGGPNPPKVGIILEELGLPYEVIPVPLSDIKKPEYVAINPNGRLPAIHDPNAGITLWESGAIIEYLIELYDTKHRLSFAPGTPESYHAKQWLYFQTTGQGPYYGQAAWFKKYHSEQVPSAIERYTKEVNRVSGVLDRYLAQQKQEHGGSAGGDGPYRVHPVSEDYRYGAREGRVQRGQFPVCKGVAWQDHCARGGENCTRKCSTFEIARLEVKFLNRGRAIRTNFLAYIYLRCTPFS